MRALWLSLTVLDAWVTVHGGEANINPWLLRGLYVYILVWLTAIWAPICESHARPWPSVCRGFSSTLQGHSSLAPADLTCPCFTEPFLKPSS